MSAPGAGGTEGFFQEAPALGNTFETDAVLRQSLQRILPADVWEDVRKDLSRFGVRAGGEMLPLADHAETHPPRLRRFDAWGQRIDQIETSAGWSALHDIAAEEGIVALGYERAHGRWSRVHQMAKLHLFHPSSAIVSCPLAMTDGAARLLEGQTDAAGKAVAARALPRLTSRDPTTFWTSGQWMTERTGGSDVGRSETVARADGALAGVGSHRLHGTKWFTSATTSQMAMTLARVEEVDGTVPGGSRGLSLFYVETHGADGRLADIEVLRLKDKLGTKALPTAELQLRGTPATLVGEQGRGVPTITRLINVTRLYNTVCAVSSFRRGLQLAQDYARRRHVFGRPLAEQPLHLTTLADLEVQLHGATVLALHCASLLGAEDCGAASADDVAELRLLTPLAKLYTARQGVAGISEIVESFGGAGYVEDTGIPRMLRDAQVLSIWEGTTNVLSLDALRAIQRDDALGPTLSRAMSRASAAAQAIPQLAPAADAVATAAGAAAGYLPRAFGEGMDALQAGARRFAYGLARIVAGGLLLEHAAWAMSTLSDERAAVAAERWCRQDLAPFAVAGEAARAGDRLLGLG
ncbi:MAG: acyl-CoA dehydrogenase family protein [Deltaproteobacteria bacterium]|nr:acyl-CoA dehydrogenase family protein [Deltaproteobacteria bacterium]